MHLPWHSRLPGDLPTAALVCGVVSLFAALQPVLGVPVGAAAIALGVAGSGRDDHDRARVGVVCGMVGIVASVTNGLAGALVSSGG